MAHFGKDLDSFSASRTVRILSSESVENYTVYLIEVTVGPYSWTVKHRYSDFHELHDKLVSTCKLDKNLLPPKKLFGNQSETFIKKRQGELEVYLQTVLYYLAHRVPPILAFFLHFNKYEIHGITQALAEELYNRGETILQSHEMFQMSPLQLHALTERLKLPEPTCESGDVKKDIGHILDFITRMKRLKICGSKESVGSSNIDMNQLTFDLTLFKSLKYLEILNCSPKNIIGLETIKQTLKEFQLCRSTKTVREFLLQDIPHWRGEDGTLLVSYWEHVEEADLSHNFIAEIDDSVQLMPKVEHLDLSHNQLTTIQHLQWLSHLTFLDISHNNIHNLDSLHTKLGNLKTLKLAGNKLGSLQGFSKLFSLEILDVSNNEIGQVSDVKPIGGLPCLENLLLTGNPVTIVLDYRTKVLEVFGDRVNEVVLDNQRPNQKELDTVAVLQALQKARDNKDKVKRLTPKKTASSASLTDSEYSRTPPNLLGEARNGSSSPSSVDLRHGSTRALSGSPLCSSYNGLSSSPFFRPEHTEFSSSPLSRTERAGLSSSPLFTSEISSSSLTGPTYQRPISSPVTRTEDAGLTGSSITTPAHQRPISSPVTKAEQAELCNITFTGAAHHSESSSPGSRPEEADLHFSPPSRPEEFGKQNSPSTDISGSHSRSAQLGISRYEEIDGLTTFKHQGPTLSSDVAQLNTVMVAADTKHQKNTTEYDIQPPDNDSKTAVDGKQPADNDSRTADSGKQPADNVEQPDDSDRDTADNTIQPADEAPGEKSSSKETSVESSQASSDKTSKLAVINYADLPTGANTEFRSWLQKQLIGGGSPSRESTKETILDILWCNAVQYSNPTVFFSCCAVLTKSKIFIERLTDLDSGLPGVPDFEPFYILPMCNIQQIVLGCCLAYVKLEESFVGKMGTFILIGLDPSVLKTYVESFKLNCESMKSLNAPEILDLSCDSDISRQIFNMEDKFGSSSDRIVYSCVVVAKPSHSRCLLVLSENRVYLIDIDCIYWPLPSFEAESEEMLQIGVMQNHPITDRISNISMYSAVNTATTPKSQLRETNVRFAEFGLSMIFHETAGPKLFDVLFPSTSSRDFYLDRLTNLRAEHAHRMSPTLREEPEGGNELVDPPDSKRMGRLPSASSLPSSFDISKYYVSKTHASVKTVPSEIKIQIQTPQQPEPVESDNPVHFTSVKKRVSKEAVYASVDVNVSEVDSLVLAYLSGELEDHLKLCIRDYKLIHPLPTKLKPFALMDGRDLATFFHTVIAVKTSPDRGGLMEELHHVLWTNVVPYSNPKMEIPTLVMLSTRGIYFVSDSSHKSESSSRPPWMTHARHQSDSAFAWKTDVGKDGSDRSVHKIKKRGTIKPYCVLKYSDLQQVNVGLFDQCIRLTGQDAHSVFTLAIRESVATGNFLQSMTGILSLLATSPMIDKDKQDLEQDFYKAFTKRTKSTIEGLEYIHPSQVRFCYPGEDAIEDILYLVKEKVHGSLPNNSKLTLWMYILGYVVPEEFLTGSTDRVLARTIILSSTHICLAEEDIVTYPLPDFVRGLPENPQHLIVESRKIENLKRIVLYSNYLNVIQLIFSDEKEELVVDASLDYFSEESINKGREPRPEFCVRLFIQSLSEKEKFLQLLKKHWKELNPEVGRILDIITE